MLKQMEEFDRLPLGQKIAVMERLAVYPSLTHITWLRKDLGYRMVNPLWLCGIALFMLLVSAFLPPASHPEFLRYWAAFTVFAGVYHRIQRWREFKRGVRRHSFYLGTSPFDFRWLPNFIRGERRIARFIDPIVCAAIGLWWWHMGLTALGGWWVFSAICLRIVEEAIYKNEETRRFDMVDNLVTSEIQSETVERFVSPVVGPKTAANQSTIATGLSPDLEAQIARRKKAKRRRRFLFF